MSDAIRTRIHGNNWVWPNLPIVDVPTDEEFLAKTRALKGSTGLRDNGRLRIDCFQLPLRLGRSVHKELMAKAEAEAKESGLELHQTWSGSLAAQLSAAMTERINSRVIPSNRDEKAAELFKDGKRVRKPKTSTVTPKPRSRATVKTAKEQEAATA